MGFSKLSKTYIARADHKHHFAATNLRKGRDVVALLLAVKCESRRCRLSYVTRGTGEAAGLVLVEQTGAGALGTEPLSVCILHASPAAALPSVQLCKLASLFHV